MPRLTRRQLDLLRLRAEIRAAWPDRDEWLTFAAVVIPLLVAALVVAMVATR